MFRLLILAAALLLPSCASMLGPTWFADAKQVEAATRVSNDAYRGIGFVSGPVQRTPLPIEHNAFEARLHLSRVFGKSIADRVEVELTGTSWVFPKEAYDRFTRRLTVNRIDSDVRGGTVSEVIMIQLPAGYLATSVTTGIDIRLDGQKGTVPVRLSAEYVRGFLSACKKSGHAMPEDDRASPASSATVDLPSPPNQDGAPK